MAIQFPSYLDALIEGFPPALKGTSVPQNKYSEDSQNVAECIVKLLGRLSILLFHIDKQINKVLIQGRFLPKKVNQWAMEARALKVQVSDLLQKQQNRKGNSLNSEQLVEAGIKLINHLKKCPCKDEMMYDKPIPVIIQKRGSGSDKTSKKLELKTGKSLDPVEGHVPHDEYSSATLASARTVLTAFHMQKEHDTGSDPVSTSGNMEGAEIRAEAASHLHELVISPAGSNSASISEDQREQQSRGEITEEDMTLEESETKVPKNMWALSDFESQQAVQSSSGEIQGVHETTILVGARSKHHVESIPNPIILEEPNYLVRVAGDCIRLELDKQTILIEDRRALTLPESSSVEPVLNLAGQNLLELHGKKGYHNSLVLFLQRNYRLAVIHSSFFEEMPDLRLVDLSDTRIRILPSSLFKLTKLKVLMLRNCICLEELPSEIGNVDKIEVLDLLGTELYDLPDKVGELTLLRLMQVSLYGPDDESEYDHLPPQLVSPSVFAELKELRALSITVHPDDHRWTTIAAHIVKDISKLEMLSYLRFYFPEVDMFESFIQMSPSWNKNILNKFNFILGQHVKRIVSRVPDEVESLLNQHDKCLRFANGDSVTQAIKTVIGHVTALYLDHHASILSLSEFGVSNCQSLKFCVVSECPKIQAILGEREAEGAFPRLEHLALYYLWELKHIWKPPSPPGRLKRILRTRAPSGNFKALKCLIVNTCPKLQFVLCQSMLQSLSNLEELVVEDCERVEKIIKEEKEKVNYDDVIFPGLRKLVLHYLPELVSDRKLVPKYVTCHDGYIVAVSHAQIGIEIGTSWQGRKRIQFNLEKMEEIYQDSKDLIWQILAQIEEEKEGLGLLAQGGFG